MNYIAELDGRIEGDSTDDEMTVARRVISGRNLPRGATYTVRVAEKTTGLMPSDYAAHISDHGRDVIVDVPAQGRMQARFA